jgi:formylglycine-generating enzyme required for sulfatase activity
MGRTGSIPSAVLAAFAVLGAPASPSDGPETNSVGLRLLSVPAGSFVMGQDGPPADHRMTRHPDRCDDADWDEKPAHRVTLTAPFRIGATEVTCGQYRRFRPEFGRGADDDEAVANVSWHDAVAFCEWLAHAEGRPYRLPTEAEWEYACRAGTGTPFAFGPRLPDGFQKWRATDGFRLRYFPDGRMPPDYRDRPAEAPLRVAQTPANAWGLLDMHGNVEEWCLDWYGPYEAGEATNPVGRADGDFRVARGGSESDFTRMLRSANRSGRLPETRSGRVGFRVVQAGPPDGAPLPPPPPAANARDVRQEAAPVAKAESGSFFSGPKPFVRIPAGSCGPLFSAHNHSPGLAECPNGDLLAVWYSCVDEGGPELMVAASRLRAGADAWDEASPFWDGPDVNDHAPKLWFDGDRTLWFFARGFAENVIRTSTDNGATWSKARLVQPCAEFANAPIRTREGFLVVPHDSRATSLIISRDGGATWTAPDAGGTKHTWRDGGQGRRLAGIHNGLVQLGDGRLMAMGRIDDAEAQKLFGVRTPVSLSSDWGATWSHAASPFPAISSVQRPVLMRLREGPLLFCSFTDPWRDWKNRRGMPFADASGGTFTGFGLFAALSEDDGRTWPVRRLLTPGGSDRSVNGIDRVEFTLGGTTAEPCGYLAACQTRDGNVQLITSKNHYVFNLAWLKALPAPPAPGGAP